MFSGLKPAIIAPTSKLPLPAVGSKIVWSPGYSPSNISNISLTREAGVKN